MLLLVAVERELDELIILPAELIPDPAELLFTLLPVLLDEIPDAVLLLLIPEEELKTLDEENETGGALLLDDDDNAVDITNTTVPKLYSPQSELLYNKV